MVIERTYVIPLRAGYRNTPKHCRTNKAVKVLRIFLAKHMKVKEEDVRLGQHINLLLWAHGIKNPPARVTVKVVKGDDGIVKAELESKEFTETVKPSPKSEQPQGLKEKLQAAVGGKKADKTDEKQGASVDAKPKPAAKKKAAPKQEAEAPAEE